MSDLSALAALAANVRQAFLEPDSTRCRQRAASLKAAADAKTTVIDQPGYWPLSPEELTPQAVFWIHADALADEIETFLAGAADVPPKMPLLLERFREFPLSRVNDRLGRAEFLDLVGEIEALAASTRTQRPRPPRLIHYGGLVYGLAGCDCAAVSRSQHEALQAFRYNPEDRTRKTLRQDLGRATLKILTLPDLEFFSSAANPARALRQLQLLYPGAVRCPGRDGKGKGYAVRISYRLNS